MTDYVAANRSTYDAIAADYTRRWSTPPAWVNAELDRLVKALPGDARIADIGCGPGRHTALLQDRGFRVVGFDLSRQMLTCGNVPGLVQADMRTLPLPDQVLDAVWCVAAMLHIPRSEVPDVLAEFSRVLRPGGLLSLSVAEGDGEGWEAVSYARTHRRWYVFHRIEPLTEQLATAGFNVVSYSRRSTHRNWLHLNAKRARSTT